MVAILFSGGKDSTYAVKYCLDNDIKIEMLIAVKPISDEAYLWHYATVEWAPLIARALDVPLTLLECNEIGPEVEANILHKILPQIKSDTIMLGGVGLQETQIRKAAEVAAQYGKKTLVPYAEFTSEELLKMEIKSGMDIMITEVAAAGLTKEWLGRKLTKENFDEFRKLARKNGFDILGEGGAYNTFVLDAPFYKNKIVFADSEIVWDAKTRSGHLKVNSAALLPKLITKGSRI